MSPAKVKHPPLSAKKRSQRSLSKGKKNQEQGSFDGEENHSQIMYSTMQQSSFLKGNKSLIDGNSDFAPLKVLTA